MTQYGPGLLDDPARLRAVLSTLLPGRQRHVSSLVAAVEDRIPAQLRSNQSRGVSAQAAVTRLAQSLADNRALDPAAALAAVRSIAEALDIPGAAAVEFPSAQPTARQAPPGNVGPPPPGARPGSPTAPGPPTQPIGRQPWDGAPTQIVNTGPPPVGPRPPAPQGQKPSPTPARKRRPLLWVLAGVIALVLLGTGVIVAIAVNNRDSKPEPKPRVVAKPTPSKAAPPVSCTYIAVPPGKGGPVPRKVTLPPSDNVSATGTVTMQMTTNKGPLVITLDRAKAPCTVNNFTSLASQKWYDDSPCHRLTTQAFYVLQCGDPLGTGLGGPGYVFADENLPAKASAFVTYPAGTVAMATATANTNSAQFFIVYRDSRLPAAFSIFGKVTSGLDIVQDIAVAGSTPAGDGKPTSPVVIESVTPQS